MNFSQQALTGMEKKDTRYLGNYWSLVADSKIVVHLSLYLYTQKMITGCAITEAEVYKQRRKIQVFFRKAGSLRKNFKNRLII